MNNTTLTGTFQAGDFTTPAELVSPPARPWANRTLLWALTLLSFLGGAYIGYRYRTVTPTTGTQLAVVQSGDKLVARWNASAPSLAGLERAQLRVNSGVRELMLPIDKATLRRGELALSVDPMRATDVALLADGTSHFAHFLAADPQDGALAADAPTLRRRIAEQQTLNAQLERRLSQSR